MQFAIAVNLVRGKKGSFKTRCVPNREIFHELYFYLRQLCAGCTTHLSIFLKYRTRWRTAFQFGLFMLFFYFHLYRSANIQLCEEPTERPTDRTNGFVVYFVMLEYSTQIECNQSSFKQTYTYTWIAVNIVSKKKGEREIESDARNSHSSHSQSVASRAQSRKMENDEENTFDSNTKKKKRKLNKHLRTHWTDDDHYSS